MTKLVYLEIAGFAAAAAFGVVRYLVPEGNWEPLVALCGMVGAAAEIARRINRRSLRGRFESNAERVQHRERLRKEFEAELYKCRAENLRQDVIIRHVDRVDNYPNAEDEGPGISSWFRVALVDLYERGIVLCLRIGSLVEDDDGYRYRDHVNGEEGDIKAWLMADVPYDSIEAVNIDGDRHYYFPHIYCHFDFKGQPYERLWFAEKIDQPHGHPYFRHIADHADVEAKNPNQGVMYFA
ncbi:hypothetical protein [Algiphilus sp.]|uniref:hypothetical protein n=1 Tax=Algiphilus sp. TaxID=1872431 RepID=UPI0032EECE82